MTDLKMITSDVLFLSRFFRICHVASRRAQMAARRHDGSEYSRDYAKSSMRILCYSARRKFKCSLEVFMPFEIRADPILNPANLPKRAKSQAWRPYQRVDRHICQSI